jgi:hypothetical protein
LDLLDATDLTDAELIQSTEKIINLGYDSNSSRIYFSKTLILEESISNSNKLLLNKQYLNKIYELVDEINNACDEINAAFTKTLFMSFSEIYDIINIAKISENNANKSAIIAKKVIKELFNELKNFYEYFNNFKIYSEKVFVYQEKVFLDAYFILKSSIEAKKRASIDIIYLVNYYQLDL